LLGRERAKRNSLNYGLTAEQIFPKELQVLIDKHTAILMDRFQPTTAYDTTLVERMGREAGKMERCDQLKLVSLQRCCERAHHYWDEDRAVYVRDLGAKLARDPYRVAAALEDSKQGIYWCLQRWKWLGDVLDTLGTWDEAQKSLVLDLLGYPVELRAGNKAIPADANTETLRALVQKHVKRLKIRLIGSRESDRADQGMAKMGMVLEEDAATRRLRQDTTRAEGRYYRAYRELMESRAEDGAATGTADGAPAGERSPAPTRRPPISKTGFNYVLKRADDYDVVAKVARNMSQQSHRERGGRATSPAGATKPAAAAPAAEAKPATTPASEAPPPDPALAERERRQLLRQARRKREKNARKANQRRRR
jgi:hypothetical protein